MNDAVRAAIIAAVSNIVKVVVLLGGLELDGTEQFLIIGTVDSIITLFFLFWKTGQGKAPPTTDQVVGEDRAQKARRKASE